MKLLRDCNIGNKVKIVGGLVTGCQNCENVVGIVFSPKAATEVKKRGICWHGFDITLHPEKLIGCVFDKENKMLYVMNNDCLVEVLENNADVEEKEKAMKDFRIVDYKVYNNKALNVTFRDGFNKEHRNEEEKAVCNEDDKFDLRRGLEICVLKHILGEDKYKQIIKEIDRQIKTLDKEAEDKKALEEMIARKKAKNAKRKARRQEKARQERINEMREAYLAAMREYGGCLEKAIEELEDGSEMKEALENIVNDTGEHKNENTY
jgi:hypothetical protein